MAVTAAAMIAVESSDVYITSNSSMMEYSSHSDNESTGPTGDSREALSLNLFFQT